MARVWCAVLVGLASCAVRPPAPVNVDALLARRGPVEARRELQIRVIGDPRDVAGRLALAELDERIARPSEAIEALEAVVALGGPLGVRWHAEDQARLARLVAARGRARLARGAASALADLERARGLGAGIADDELRAARIAGAIVALHHSDAEQRAGGRRTLARDGGSVDEWLGARAGASPGQRGRFGVWLWQHGARRAGWDELSAWHAATQPPRDRELQGAYLIAARWWIPLDRPAPPADDLVGFARCGFAPCAPHEVVGDDLAERAYLLAPLPPPVRDPIDAAALAAITLHHALRGETSWGAALAARVDIAALAEPAQLARLPRHVQPLFARLVGRDAPIPGDGATADERLVLAATRVLAGAGAAEIDALVTGSPYADDLRRIAAPRAPFTGDAVAEAAARHADLTVPGAAVAAAATHRDPAVAEGATVDPVPATGGPESVAQADPTVSASPRLDALRAIVVAYRRDPLIADRLGRDAVAGAADAAAMHATLAALFDALGDPARARTAWQAAVDASPEPAFVRGLAEAQARQGDGDAALINATAAAAASGDPAVVWTSVARALAGVGKYAHALEAVRSAIDLSGPETLAAAFDVAIAASRALGRDAQAASLSRQRARVAREADSQQDSDPIDTLVAPRNSDPPGARGVPASQDPSGTRATSANSDAPRTAASLAANDPTDARAALAGLRKGANSAAIDRLWVASRWNPRNVRIRVALLAAIGGVDPQRGIVVGELVDLAGDRDPDIRRAAVAALR